jgi:hypothetical protein
MIGDRLWHQTVARPRATVVPVPLGNMQSAPTNTKGRPKAALDIPQRNSLSCLIPQERKGGTLKHRIRGHLSPGEAPGPPRSRGASLIFISDHPQGLWICALLSKGCDALQPFCSPQHGPVADALPPTARSVIGGRPPNLHRLYHGAMESRNDQTACDSGVGCTHVGDSTSLSGHVGSRMILSQRGFRRASGFGMVCGQGMVQGGPSKREKSRTGGLSPASSAYSSAITAKGRQRHGEQSRL